VIMANNRGLQDGSPPNLGPSTLMGFNPNSMMGGLAGLFGGMFGNSGAPYSAAMDQYQQWMNKAQGMQNPFYQAGVNAIPDYQNWLKSMQDPSGFINNLMGKYQQSPWAKYQTDQAMRAAQNMGSAGGLTGSTPLTQFAQQQASGISSGDMQNWLQNVLGVNTQYGAGEAGLMQGGQNAANALTNMYGQMAPNMAGLAYGQQAGGQNDMWNMIGGGLSLAGSFL
jgi:hypothetical protein